MSTPNKSLDKSKRFAGVKANDFVNKARPNDANRSAGTYQACYSLSFADDHLLFFLFLRRF
jgi:hypothetical protein